MTRLPATAVALLASAFAVVAFALTALAADPMPAPSGNGQECVGGASLGPVTGEAPFVRADVRAVAETLTCYCGCPHLQVSKCFCGTADEIRSDIAARLDRGETPEAIQAAYVAEHGAGIMAVPPRKGFHWIAWAGPPLGVLVAAVAAWAAARRWSRVPPAPQPAPAPLDTEAEARYRAELRRAVEEG